MPRGNCCCDINKIELCDFSANYINSFSEALQVFSRVELMTDYLCVSIQDYKSTSDQGLLSKYLLSTSTPYSPWWCSCLVRVAT